MARSELVTAIRQLTAERDLPMNIIIDAVQEALAATYKRQYGATPEVRVALDTDTGEFHVYAEKKVVIEVRDERTEISLKDAQAYPDRPGLNEMVEVEVTPPNFGRIAAQTAKQTILQRIQEAERDLVYEEFANREGEILNGLIERVEPRGMIVNLGKAEAVLPPAEQVPRERYRINQRLKVYLVKVERGVRTPQLIVSRSHRGLVRRLFEVEVPEIFNGTVELKAIAREPGSRTKVAVVARQEGIDPVGACVGMRGVRIQNVVNELNGEKIDVVQWSERPDVFVANALSPAQVLSVEIVEGERRAIVTVPDAQLSLAIGKEGQNARLAAKLTGWRVDIKKQSDVAAERAARQPGRHPEAHPGGTRPDAHAAAAKREPEAEDELETATMAELLEQVPVEVVDEV
ncbi:MAG: transcription termination/antitermination protein NusA [Chloroflexi bacterium]|nr:transcription termination/antitermination protein NusA [Chloroflexota bacterium]